MNHLGLNLQPATKGKRANLFDNRRSQRTRTGLQVRGSRR